MTDKKTALFIVNFVAESVSRAEKRAEKIEDSKVETQTDVQTEVQTTEPIITKEPEQEPPAVPPREDVPDIPTISTISTANQPPKTVPLPPTIKPTKAPPPPKSAPKLQKAESSGDVLSELITKGSKALKKVEILPELSKVDNQDDLAGALAKALAARRNFIKDKQDDSDEEQNWDD